MTETHAPEINSDNDLKISYKIWSNSIIGIKNGEDHPIKDIAKRCTKKELIKLSNTIKNILFHIKIMSGRQDEHRYQVKLVIRKVKLTLESGDNLTWALQAGDYLWEYLVRKSNGTFAIDNTVFNRYDWLVLTRKMMPREIVHYYDNILKSLNDDVEQINDMDLNLSVKYVANYLGVISWEFPEDEDQFVAKVRSMIEDWRARLVKNIEKYTENKLYKECAKNIIQLLELMDARIDDAETTEKKNILLEIISGLHYENANSLNHDKKIYHILSNIMNDKMEHQWLHYRYYLSGQASEGTHRRLQGINAFDLQVASHDESKHNGFLYFYEYIEMMAGIPTRAVHYEDTVVWKRQSTTQVFDHAKMVQFNAKISANRFGFFPYWLLKHPNKPLQKCLKLLTEVGLEADITRDETYPALVDELTKNINIYPGYTWSSLFYPFKGNNEQKCESIYKTEIERMISHAKDLFTGLRNHLIDYTNAVKTPSPTTLAYIQQYSFSMPSKINSVDRMRSLIGINKPLTVEAETDLDFFCKVIVHHHIPNILSKTVSGHTSFSWKTEMQRIALGIFSRIDDEIKPVLWESAKRMLKLDDMLQLNDNPQSTAHIYLKHKHTPDEIVHEMVSNFVTNVAFSLPDTIPKLDKKTKIHLTESLHKNHRNEIYKLILKFLGHVPFVGVFTILLQKQVCFLVRMFAPRIMDLYQLEKNQSQIYKTNFYHGLNNYLFEVLFTKLTLMTGLTQPLECLSNVIPMVFSSDLFGFRPEHPLDATAHVSFNKYHYPRIPTQRYNALDINEIAKMLKKTVDLLEKSVQGIKSYATAVESWNWIKANLSIPTILHKINQVHYDYTSLEDSITSIDDHNVLKQQPAYMECEWLIEQIDSLVLKIHHHMNVFSINIADKYRKTRLIIDKEIESIRNNEFHYGDFVRTSTHYDNVCTQMFGQPTSNYITLLFKQSNIDEFLALLFASLKVVPTTEYPRSKTDKTMTFHNIVHALSVYRQRCRMLTTKDHLKEGEKCINIWHNKLHEIDEITVAINKIAKNAKNSHSAQHILEWWTKVKTFLTTSTNVLSNDANFIGKITPLWLSKNIPDDLLFRIECHCIQKMKMSNFLNFDNTFYLWLSEFISYYLAWDWVKIQLVNNFDPRIITPLHDDKLGDAQEIVADKTGKMIFYRGASMKYDDNLITYIVQLMTDYARILDSLVKSLQRRKLNFPQDIDSFEADYPHSTIKASTGRSYLFSDISNYLIMCKRGFIHPLILKRCVDNYDHKKTHMKHYYMKSHFYDAWSESIEKRNILQIYNDKFKSIPG